jgi:hypothetical protein
MCMIQYRTKFTSTRINDSGLTLFPLKNMQRRHLVKVQEHKSTTMGEEDCEEEGRNRNWQGAPLNRRFPPPPPTPPMSSEGGVSPPRPLRGSLAQRETSCFARPPLHYSWQLYILEIRAERAKDRRGGGGGGGLLHGFLGDKLLVKGERLELYSRENAARQSRITAYNWQ